MLSCRECAINADERMLAITRDSRWRGADITVVLVNLEAQAPGFRPGCLHGGKVAIVTGTRGESASIRHELEHWGAIREEDPGTPGDGESNPACQAPHGSVMYYNIVFSPVEDCELWRDWMGIDGVACLPGGPSATIITGTRPSPAGCHISIETTISVRCAERLSSPIS